MRCVDTRSSKSKHRTANSMHVVVSGAGPCGLLVALQLQLAGIRCTVLERAAESQLEADVGSGYEP